MPINAILTPKRESTAEQLIMKKEEEIIEPKIEIIKKQVHFPKSEEMKKHSPEKRTLSTKERESTITIPKRLLKQPKRPMSSYNFYF